MLEFDDIQHFVLTRVPAITGRYEFLSFQEPSQGRDWLAGIIDKIETAQAAAAGIEQGKRWVSVALRSEEHTSELQSLAYLVCRLLLEKKKTVRLSRTGLCRRSGRGLLWFGVLWRLCDVFVCL